MREGEGGLSGLFGVLGMQKVVVVVVDSEPWH
jgi:hypothetical protein